MTTETLATELPPKPQKFVLINERVYWVDSERDIARAQDDMAEEQIEKTPIHSIDGLCDDLEFLVARQFVAIPYVRTDSEDCSHTTYAIVRARDVKHAVKLVSERGGLIDNEAWWSKAANKSGDTVERAGDGCFYLMWPCDCGDTGCEYGEHDSQTETIVFGFDAAVAGPDREFAVYLNNGREPAVEYLET